jgi:hypothetical protein
LNRSAPGPRGGLPAFEYRNPPFLRVLFQYVGGMLPKLNHQ